MFLQPCFSNSLLRFGALFGEVPSQGPRLLFSNAAASRLDLRLKSVFSGPNGSDFVLAVAVISENRQRRIRSVRCPPRLGTKTRARDANKCCLNVHALQLKCVSDRIASYAMHGAGATVLVNIMRIPCFGRRMTIGRASIIWPGAN
jgi:hypothetical protein